MEGTNFTPVDLSHLELLWKKKGRSLRMEIAFAAIGILTILVAGLILVMLMNRTKETQQTQKITPKKVTPSPTSAPTATPSPADDAILPAPEDTNDASGSAVPDNTTLVPPAEATTIPPEVSPTAAM